MSEPTTSPVREQRQPLTLPRPETPTSPIETFNRDKAEGLARNAIAYTLLALTFLIIIGAFIMGAYAISSTGPIKDNLNSILAILNVIYGPIIALLGSATGFYFGANAAKAPVN
jgi:hypothetical protein